MKRILFTSLALVLFALPGCTSHGVSVSDAGDGKYAVLCPQDNPQSCRYAADNRCPNGFVELASDTIDVDRRSPTSKSFVRRRNDIRTQLTIDCQQNSDRT